MASPGRNRRPPHSRRFPACQQRRLEVSPKPAGGGAASARKRPAFRGPARGPTDGTARAHDSCEPPSGTIESNGIPFVQLEHSRAKRAALQARGRMHRGSAMVGSRWRTVLPSPPYPPALLGFPTSLIPNGSPARRHPPPCLSASKMFSPVLLPSTVPEAAHPSQGAAAVTVGSETRFNVPIPKAQKTSRARHDRASE